MELIQFQSKKGSPSNRIQCELHSKTDSTIKPKIGFNINSIQKQIQPLNPQIGFNEFHSKNSTIKTLK